MNCLKNSYLSKRERQIMQVIYFKNNASAKEVLNELPNPPSYSAIRTLLKILVKKGVLKYQKVGSKFIYSSITPSHTACRDAINSLLETFFHDSLEEAILTIIELNKTQLDEKTIDTIINRMKMIKN